MSKLLFTIVLVIILLIKTRHVLIYPLLRVTGKILNNTFFWVIISFVGAVEIRTNVVSVILLLLCIFFTFFAVLGKFTLFSVKKKISTGERLLNEEKHIEKLCQEYGLPNPTIWKYEFEQEKLLNSVEQKYTETLPKGEPSSGDENISKIITIPPMQYEIHGDDNVIAMYRDQG